MARKRKEEAPRLAAVHWVDAEGSDLQGVKVAPVHTLRFGFVVEEGDDYIVVASEVFADGSYRDHIAIPLGMVKSVTHKPLRVPDEFEGWAPRR